MNRKKHIPPAYTYISNEAINKIADPYALGVYAYLCSIPPGRDISIKNLQDQFRCDAEHITKCLQYLKKTGVLEGDFEGDIE